MKKFLTLIIAVALLSSCEDSADAIVLTASSSVSESVMISIPQSTVSVDYDETINQDLNNVVSNLSDVTAINIDQLSYKFKNATGNTGATISSATLVVNGVTIATISNINITQESQNNTVFQITDTNVLDQLETIFLNNSTVTIQFSGTAVDGPIDFEMEVSIDLTVTL